MIRVDNYSKGQPKKTWMEEIYGILIAIGIKDDDSEDRTEIRNKINLQLNT